MPQTGDIDLSVIALGLRRMLETFGQESAPPRQEPPSTASKGLTSVLRCSPVSIPMLANQ